MTALALASRSIPLIEKCGDPVARATDDGAIAAHDDGALNQRGPGDQKVDDGGGVADVGGRIETKLLEPRILAHQILGRILEHGDQALEAGPIGLVFQIEDLGEAGTFFRGDRRGVDRGASMRVVIDGNAGAGPARGSGFHSHARILITHAPTRAMLGGVDKVVLRDIKDDDGSRYLAAERKPSGDIVIEGQDLGPGVERFLGCYEYEWIWTIKAADVGRLAEALGGTGERVLELLAEKFGADKAAGLRAFLSESAVAHEVWSRMGD